MLQRPRGGFLGSSRAARRASLRAERRKALGHALRTLLSAVEDVWGTAVDLFVLWSLPLAYLGGAYLLVDLPARWAVGREPFTGTGFLLFLGSVAISLVGLSRMIRRAPPVAPVRPQFARAMLIASWVGAVLCTMGDLAVK